MTTFCVRGFGLVAAGGAGAWLLSRPFGWRRRSLEETRTEGPLRSVSSSTLMGAFPQKVFDGRSLLFPRSPVRAEGTSQSSTKPQTGFFDPMRVRGNYENRIKFASTPEKVFEYFASFKDPDTKKHYMTLRDFMESVLPWNFGPFCSRDLKEQEEMVENALKAAQGKTDNTKLKAMGVESFMELVDHNRDGRISFAEYLFFTTLMTTKLDDFRTGFKLYSSPTPPPNASDSEIALTKDEFVRLMVTMICVNPRGRQQKHTKSEKIPGVALPDPRGVHLDESVFELCGNCLKGKLGVVLFGNDGDESLSFEKFSGVFRGLKKDLLFQEVFRASGGDLEGTGEEARISPAAMGLLLIHFVPPSKMETLARRVGSLELSEEKKISFGDVVEFDKCIYKLGQLRTAVELLDGSGGLTRATLERALRALASGGGGKGSQSGPSSDGANSGGQGDASASSASSPPASFSLFSWGGGSKKQEAAAPPAPQPVPQPPRHQRDFREIVDVVFRVFDFDGSGTLAEDEFFALIVQRGTAFRVFDEPLWIRRARGIAKCAKKVYSFS
uniref:EF-hand domain-containing protein n=1 Tax=Chromera velia CCMP2878 TaxID=1169474 RepID=A0A0G4HNX1_9ALVE|eukprot:Cvel_7696.t1-p1 / transcript=Cvel_7696.t1 / gene=Cvel_7696 / organism=Chromera_velia_CCMP2878 / gene_product=Calcium uptake protein 1, mitochondrial, putative / transcript_product=Calcium uptake protein 1, mitochondrial, putative / location=Cvel_scaffold408:76802-79756(+) / protein_length=555 / sequence_SO=supercontig / SO=protein_coding / is_pseudo=false